MVDFADLGRNLVVGAGTFTPAVSIGDATVVELQVVNLTGSANLTLEWSADGNNWQAIGTTTVGVGVTEYSPDSSLTAGWLRVNFTVDFGSPLILRTSVNLFSPDVSTTGTAVPPAPPIA
jgi:hypothetical protein